MRKLIPMLLVVEAATAAAASCTRTQVISSFPESFVGVGLELTMNGDGPVVVQALPGGPSAEAGLMTGDRVLEIDGKSVAGKSLGDVVMLLRGQPETQVSVAVTRENQRITIIVRRRRMSRQAEGYRPSQ